MFYEYILIIHNSGLHYLHLNYFEIKYFPEVTCSRELGGYVVENGIMEFPRTVWPYLDYHGIGEEFYASYNCAYTESGLVVRKEEEPEVEEGHTQGIQIQ